MGNLTYSLLYTPQLESNPGVSYLCSDKKIHIRFRDYIKPQLISGFEKKLTYLLTYLVNFSYVNKLKEVKDIKPKAITDALINSPDVEEIIQSVRTVTISQVKGLKIFDNYKRKECIPFGTVDEDAFPNTLDMFGKRVEGTLKLFLDKLNINLYDYLYNDCYSILIHEKSEKEINSKFINKQLKKEQENDFVKLW